MMGTSSAIRETDQVSLLSLLDQCSTVQMRPHHFFLASRMNTLEQHFLRCHCKAYYKPNSVVFSHHHHTGKYCAWSFLNRFSEARFIFPY